VASASYTLPKTAQSAPPNFYSQAGQMAAGQGAGAGAGGKSAGGPGGSSAGPATPGSGVDPSEAKSEFVQNMAKLLKVLAAMGKTKPNGVDIKKYTDAAAQVMHDCLEQVSTGGDDNQTPDTTDQGSPADVGSTGPPAAAAPPGGGAGAGASSPAAA
jgi:hypothetical protein